MITAKKLDSDGQHETIDKDNKCRAFEIFQLRRLDFSIDLRERFLAAHGED